MYGINTEEDFRRFHAENLSEIKRIRNEYLTGSGIKAIIAKRKAKKALKRRVNDKAQMFGLQYNLDGMFMSAADIGFDGQYNLPASDQKLRGI